MSKEKKSIKELGKEYEKHAKLQQSFIDNCRTQLNKAKNMGDMDAVKKLQSNLRKFYEIKKELEETAEHLKKYYKGDS